MFFPPRFFLADEDHPNALLSEYGYRRLFDPSSSLERTVPVLVVTQTYMAPRSDGRTRRPNKSMSRIASTLEIYDVPSGETQTVLSADEHFEAPNWTPDGDELVFNSGGRLYRVPVEPSRSIEPTVVDTGDVDDIINDHGLSPSGDRIAFTSDGHIWTAPTEGGQPVRVTTNTPSYWHGWSPDGERHAFCGEREGNYNLYTIPAEGGTEQRLTDGQSYDDGPDYTPDGEYIYYCSDESGTWELWRIVADGGTPERVTDERTENWFPHPSPDGEKAVYLAYPPGTEGHPPEKPVELRLLDLETHETEGLHRLFGGQGTINVPSWHPEGDQFAFVSYRRR